jgi:hypothetical protein
MTFDDGVDWAYSRFFWKIKKHMQPTLALGIVSNKKTENNQNLVISQSRVGEG